MIDKLHSEIGREVHPYHEVQNILRAAILRNSHLADKNLSIELQDREIVLKGVVGSYYQKQLAQEAIRGLSGNSPIRNELDVLAY